MKREDYMEVAIRLLVERTEMCGGACSLDPKTREYILGGLARAPEEPRPNGGHVCECGEDLVCIRCDSDPAEEPEQ